jgi:hypothetical protein
MGRVVEIVVIVNGLLGIGAFLAAKGLLRRAKRTITGDDDEL